MCGYTSIVVSYRLAEFAPAPLALTALGRKRLRLDDMFGKLAEAITGQANRHLS